jgi:transketolase
VIRSEPPAPGPRDPDSWQLLQLLDSAPGFLALSDALVELADSDPRVVVMTADLKYSNGLVRFAEAHPDRFWQFGISEQNMVSAAAGMATCGLLPYAATFASFLALLCCEQIRTDVCYQRLPVRLIGHHSGIALGFYGTSHHATEDMGILRTMANMTIVAPADPAALRAAVHASASHPGPMYLRLSRGRDSPVYPPNGPADFEIGRAITLGEGDDVTIVATGSMVLPSLGASELLGSRGISAGVLDMHTVKPLDVAAIRAAAERAPLMVTVEEHNRLGGLGSAVAEAVTEIDSEIVLRRHGIDDEFSLIGPPTHLYEHYRLDAGGIAEFVEALVVARANGSR